MRYFKTLTFIRFEEYLLFIALFIFLFLDHLGLIEFKIQTRFIKAGFQLFSLFTILYLLVVIFRTDLQTLKINRSINHLLIGFTILIPFGFLALLFLKIVPQRNYSIRLHYGWFLPIAYAGYYLVLYFIETRIKRATQILIKTSQFFFYLFKEALLFIRDWFPYILLLAIYENALSLIVKINPRLYDPQLFLLDEIIFGGHIDLWLQKFITPARTEGLAFFYNLLYFYPIVIGMILYMRGQRRQYRNFMLVFILAGYFGYIGYSLVPVIGPAYYFQNLYSVKLTVKNTADNRSIPGPESSDNKVSFYTMSQEFNEQQVDHGHIPRNCFPSLHTAWALISIGYSLVYLPGLFLVIFIPLLLLIVATVYLRFHYLIDLIAGAMLVLFTVTVVPRINRVWSRFQSVRIGSGMHYQEAGVSLGWFRQSPLYKAFHRKLLAVSGWWYQLGYIKPLLGILLPCLFFSTIGLFLYHAAPGKGNQSKVEAVFENSVKLLGVTFAPNPPAAGEEAKLTLYWQKLRPTAEGIKIFVHGEPVGHTKRFTLDHHAVSGLYPIHKWKIGEIVQDEIAFRISPILQKTRINIWVGLFYEQDIGHRMRISKIANMEQDKGRRVKIISITVK